MNEYITFPGIHMFLLQYSSLPNSDVCIATQYAFSHRSCCKKGDNPQNFNCTGKEKGSLFYQKQML